MTPEFLMKQLEKSQTENAKMRELLCAAHTCISLSSINGDKNNDWWLEEYESYKRSRDEPNNHEP